MMVIIHKFIQNMVIAMVAGWLGVLSSGDIPRYMVHTTHIGYNLFFSKFYGAS